jgi:hypothetical protein
MQRLPSIAWIVLMALAFAAAPIEAQSLSGAILGSVADASKAAVPGARIVIRNLGTSDERVVASNAFGDYEAPALPVGEYEISCRADGFKAAVRSGVVLRVDQRLRVDFSLALGAVEERIEITGAPALVETDTAAQGTVVENRRIVELPLNGRNFQQLAYLGPGVIAPPPGSGDRFSVSGVRGTSNSFMLDGATNGQPDNDSYVDPSIDLIHEFKIQRNTFNAEYGHGAAQINVVTKSGTNSLRFTVFEFLRNDKLQARNFFGGSSKPALRRNQFGATVSGPLIRNRTFWLFNYEGVRQRSPATLLGGFPTQAELDGDLSSGGRAIRDPWTRQPFPGNRIPASVIDRTTQTYQQFVPVTNLPLGTFGRGQNYQKAVSHPSDTGQLTIKLDQNFRQNMRAFARYTMNRPESVNRRISELWDSSSRSKQYNAVAGWNAAFHSNAINEFRMSWGRSSSSSRPRVATRHPENFARLLGLTNMISGAIPEANALPTVNITGFTGMGGPAWTSQRLNTYSLVDNFSWVKGRHTVKAGLDVRREMVDLRNIGSTNGTFGFTGVFSGSPMGDYLLGVPQSANATSPPGLDGVNLGTLWQAFVQDDWKIGSWLTFSFGVRYEYPAPFINDRDRISRFDPLFPGGRLIYPGDARYYVPDRGFLPSETGQPLASRGLYETGKNLFAPRFGFAWRPFHNNNTVLRASYGIFTEAPNEISYAVSVNNPPHLLRQSIVNDVTNPKYRWSGLFPAAPPEGSSQIGSVAARLPAGYLQQWSFNIQRQLLHGIVLETGYMGNKGTRLDQTRNINQAVLDANPARPTPIATRAPYPAFAPNMVYYDRTAFSTYHGFILRLEREFSHGASVLSSYTFSKMIDNASFRGSIGAQPAFPQNSYDLRSEKGLSYFDAPHRFVTSWIQELPFGRGRRYFSAGLLSHILGGWQSVGIFQYQTGNPWSIGISGDWANVGTGNARADLAGNPFPASFRRGGTERLAFDPAAFALPARGTFGNSGRNIIRDAALNNWDLGMFKNFRFVERVRLQFRAEFFNAWNHTQFQQFANLVNTPAFATWNSARAPRIIQFGLKLVY